MRKKTAGFCIKHAAIICDTDTEGEKTFSIMLQVSADQHSAQVLPQASSFVPNQTADSTDEFVFLEEQDNDR